VTLDYPVTLNYPATVGYPVTPVSGGTGFR
jgi:hypothetical protein